MDITIGERVRSLRVAAGLTRRKLSKLAGLSPATVQAIESRSGSIPRSDTIAAIDAVLGHGHWLLTGIGDAPTPRSVRRAMARIAA